MGELTRIDLERRQVWIYLAAILAGLALGSARPSLAPVLGGLLWPVLALLLYTTFVQVPLLHVRDALGDLRFVACVVVGNFVLVPLVVRVLLQGLPADPALRLGVALVLLVPCTDWFITFSQLGQGSTSRAIAVTPVNLLLQLVLLPVHLWWILPASHLDAAFRPADVLPAAASLIGLPLLLAVLSERWMERRPERAVWRERLGWGPVFLLATVVFLIAAAQAPEVQGAGATLLRVTPVYVAYLVLAAVLARLLATLFRLDADSGRTLAFSMGTRNSFVVLPLAIALPEGWETTGVVIVYQSLVELFGMLLYLRWLPRTLFRSETVGNERSTGSALG